MLGLSSWDFLERIEEWERELPGHDRKLTAEKGTDRDDVWCDEWKPVLI